MTRRVAIVGAGPAGLVAAKAALDAGLTPTVFEAAAAPGGMWRTAWPGLRLNLSRFTCSFSDLDWPAGTPDFPCQPELVAYLDRFVELCGLAAYLRRNHRISGLDELRGYAGVILATGGFGRPATEPTGPDRPAATYRGPDEWAGRRVIVVGMSFSGTEIAAELAAADVAVTVVATRGVWLRSRYTDGLPWDLRAHRRSVRAVDLARTGAEANQARARRYHEAGGNPGRLHPLLALDPDSTDPPHVVFTENLIDQARSGRLAVAVGRVVRRTAHGVRLDTGTEVPGDVVIWCTGYRPELSILTPAQRGIIGYGRQPLLLHDCTFHPDLPGVAFVGLYRGPYFAVMELQARWACAVFAGELAAPTEAEQRRGVADAQALGEEYPRPQFPYGDYVGLADRLAGHLGVQPDPVPLWDDPVVAAHYRLTGRSARPEPAWRSIRSVRQRMGEAA